MEKKIESIDSLDFVAPFEIPLSTFDIDSRFARLCFLSLLVSLHQSRPLHNIQK